MSPLVCPSCHGPLSSLTQSYQCRQCAHRLSAKQGLVDLLGSGGYYWGEISPQQSRDLLSKAEKDGFQSAVNWLESIHPGMSEYMLSFSRADWIYSAVNLSEAHRALDIGSGWGAITFALSRHLPEVWSVESVLPRIRFQQIRARQEKQANIHFVRSDWLTLPFSDNSFDLVVANGVLEWIGLSDYSRNPGDLQRQFLSEIYRILKPAGCLYIGIENRYAFFLFLGSLDHSGLPFTSLVPRPFADWIVRKYRRTHDEYVSGKRMSSEWPDYRTYTYSMWGYRRLLKSAGFAQSKFKWALSYNSPTEAGLFDGESFSFLLKHFAQHNFSVTLSSKLATKFGSRLPPAVIRHTFPLFCPSFLIFAYKHQVPETFESRLVSAQPGVTSFVRRSGTHGLSSRINYFLLKRGRPVQIAKFPRFPQFSKEVAKEQELFCRFNDLKMKKKIVSGRLVYLEDYLPGHICQSFSGTDNKLCMQWLAHFQDKNSSGNWSVSSYQKFARQFTDIIPRFGLPHATQAQLTGLMARFLDQSAKANLPKVAEHGDFVKTNIIVGDSKVYVLDWEFYNLRGCPLLDLWTFLFTNSRVGNMPGCLTNNFTGRGPYSAIMKSLLVGFSLHLRLPLSLLAAAAPYVLVRGLAKRYIDQSGKHLDTKSISDLIQAWCTIDARAYGWLTS